MHRRTVYALSVELADHTVDSFFAWLIVCIEQGVGIAIEALLSQLLLDTTWYKLQAMGVSTSYTFERVAHAPSSQMDRTV